MTGKDAAAWAAETSLQKIWCKGSVSVIMEVAKVREYLEGA